MKGALILCWALAIGCTGSVRRTNEQQMEHARLTVRGEKEFERQTKGLPIGFNQAEKIALDFQKRRYPNRARVVIGPVVGFNAKEYLLTSPGKDGTFKYSGILVDAYSGEVSLKDADDGRVYKIDVWVRPFIWSE
jgi:hypothetical protein